MKALAAAGFHAVAPDQRGYGQTDRPQPIEEYTLCHLVGDMVGVSTRSGQERAAVVGHDWGAPVAWNAALMRPDRFREFGPQRAVLAARVEAADERHAADGDLHFYQLYFQEPGVAEADSNGTLASTLRRFLFRLGRAPRRADDPLVWEPPGMVPRTGGFLYP